MFLKNIVFFFLLIVLCVGYRTAHAENCSVIIIGAGPSGTAAAARLLENNINDILVLEAEPRTGGRIYSVKFGDGYVDLGAQFCHGTDGNVVYDLAKDLNLLVPNVDDVDFFISTGEMVQSDFKDKLLEIMKSVYDADTKIAGNLTAKDFYMSRYNNSVLETFKNDSLKLNVALQAGSVFEKYLQSSEGTFSLSDAAANSDSRLVDNINLRWNGTGYKVILDILTKNYPDATKALPFEEKLRLNKEVTKINWNDEQVHLELSDGSRYTADHVIFTPSVGVLKHSHKTIFDPELPLNKHEAIDGIGMDAIMTIHLYFSQRWWQEGNEFVGASFIWNEEDKNEFNKNVSGVLKSGRLWMTDLFSIDPILRNPNVLTSWLVGDLIPDIELMDDETVVNGVFIILDRFLGKKYNVTKPDKLIRNNWYTNPHFRGTYSYQTLNISQKTPSMEVILSQPVTNSAGKVALLFAGEATHPHYYSTVHGAIESGYREADRIIRMYQNDVSEQ